MAKSPKIKIPIMPPDDERFMAFEGLVQWTQAVVMQSARVSAADKHQFALGATPAQRRQAIHAFHSECHFFAIAAYKLLEYRKLAHETFGLCSSVDFGEVDRFSEQDIRDLRDMREHVVDYFSGKGWVPDRWVAGDSDASSRSGTVIGGRLDWVAFGAAAKRLLPQLLAEPIPYPSQATRPSTA
jgi:hypothetical protein